MPYAKPVTILQERPHDFGQGVSAPLPLEAMKILKI